MYTPVILSAGLFFTSIWAVFNRWTARILMPIVSVLNMLDGLIGFFLHIRGVHRKPGGWRLPVFNVVMGPPLMAPLLFMSSGFLGWITAFLRREEDLIPPLPKGRYRRSLWLDMLPQELTRDISTVEQEIREGRFQRLMGVATAISGCFSGGTPIQTVGPLPIAFAKQMMVAKGAWGWGMRRVMMDYNHWAPLGVLGEILPWEDNRVELADEKDQYGLRVAKVTFGWTP
jgi:hypothetical protein